MDSLSGKVSESERKLYIAGHGRMFGSHSFINISDGKEVFDGEGGYTNMVEVAVVMTILQMLYKSSNASKKKICVGVISLFAAQVAVIQQKIGNKFENNGSFSVKAKLIGSGEDEDNKKDDIVILSTVRSSADGTTGFTTNVDLPRPRQSLWILGNERTLIRSGSFWEDLIREARAHSHFFNAEEHEQLGKVILETKKELDQLADLLNGDSLLFKSAKWKIFFSDNFKKSFVKLKSIETKNVILFLLSKLSSGWRSKRRNLGTVSEHSLGVLQQYKVAGLYVVFSVEVVKESRNIIQVLKVWDVLSLEDAKRLVERLESIFGMYSDDYLNRCKFKYTDGNLEVPMCWTTPHDFVQYKDDFVENSKVSDSLLLMKFYSYSSGVVSLLLCDCDGKELGVPFELTEQEKEIVFFNRSTFIQGRSGTGKTTVLTMKLFQNEQMHHIASEGFHDVNQSKGCSRTHEVVEIENENERKGAILRQIFVTLSPMLCFAVRQQVSQLKRFICEGNATECGSIRLDDIAEMAQFKDIPDSFVNLPVKSYPLVITFHKFLMMLDGTVGTSYFQHFVRQACNGKANNSRTIDIEVFIRRKEVNYDRFNYSYWPHFNVHFTKKLSSNTVFTQIMSVIKGGLLAAELRVGNLSREEYVSLSEHRVSTFCREKRERIYNIFLQYENIKLMNGDFDMADLVTDLHSRLKKNRYEGDEIDFVYIDEVQDLSMRQIALFKYICSNVNEGFVFAGDTAQTIAKGIDFRFEDIRCLFYNEFISRSRLEVSGGRKEKGKMSDIFNLSQNFTTHSGILKLAQSVVDLLYHFFPSSIDVLNPETSALYGEAPMLLDGNHGIPIMTTFGHRESDSGEIVGFGAKQVILVRDDYTRKEICHHVEKKAIVLTIMESKGLEFQDVLLYNFFSSSPFSKWSLINYMKERDLFNHNSSSFPRFNQEDHSVLCSELKLLYVAISRTKQRLWICDDISGPMFDYWKRLGIVKIGQLDDSFVNEIEAPSRNGEWKSQGIKLFNEHCYDMAMMCFERAGETDWFRWAEAEKLRATANSISGSSNAERWSNYLREAAEIFDSIGKIELSAQCFFELNEYERAAKLYAKAGLYLKCLWACSDGKLFNLGFEYLQSWDQNSFFSANEMNAVAQDFMQIGAQYYLEKKNKRAMMKFVNSFHSKDLIRAFLRTSKCLKELLLLEEEWENFVEAAKIARELGDLPQQAALLEKAGCLEDASMVLLWYVLASSLWVSGSKGWPLKNFFNKEELLEKAEFWARNCSDRFFELVHAESNVLSDRQSNLAELERYRTVSIEHESLRGEILSTWKILDIHFSLDASMYEWNLASFHDHLSISEYILSERGVSVETLIFFWNNWKDNIVELVDYLGNIDFCENTRYEEFCLNYMGVWKHDSNRGTVYFLLHSYAKWVGRKDYNGNIFYIHPSLFGPAALSYWRSVMLSVGVNVMKILNVLYEHSGQNSISVLHRIKLFVHLFEIAEFLQEHNLFEQIHDVASMQIYCELIEKFCNRFVSNIFPIDWRRSLTEGVIFHRRTKHYDYIVRQILLENISTGRQLTLGQIGSVVMVILGSDKLPKELYQKIFRCFCWNLQWRKFIQTLNVYRETGMRRVSLVCRFHEALESTYLAHRRTECNAMSITSFLYLVERLLLLASQFQACYFTAKSSFVEWLIFHKSGVIPSVAWITYADQSWMLERVYNFLAGMVQKLLLNKHETSLWIVASSYNLEDHPLVVLRLVVILCLLCVNSGKYFYNLFNLLGRIEIRSQLPWEFIDAIWKTRSKNDFITALIDALGRIENPLVQVNSRNFSNFSRSDGILINMEAGRSSEDVLQELFLQPEILPQ